MKQIPAIDFTAAGWMTTIVALFVFGFTHSLDAIEADTVYPTDPAFATSPTVPGFPPRLKTLWLEALARPEIDLKRKAADTIAVAKQSGMANLEDTAPRLVAELEAPKANPIVKLAAARALIALDARQTADVLMKHALADSWDVAQLIEPALARWKHGPMNAVWLKRLDDPATRSRPLLLTIQCLGTAEFKTAVPRLRELALNKQLGPDVRLSAARILGQLKAEKSEEDARQLAAGDPVANRVDHLVAATLLIRHQGAAAEQLLLQLAVDPEPAVDAIALRRLLELNPLLVEPINGQILINADGNVRILAAEIFQGQKTVAAIGHLGVLLDDVHPQVRTTAQVALIELAKIDTLNAAVRETAMKVLASDAPRGLEQAALVLGGIDHKPAADRLLQLLHHADADVSITAAWALRRLLVPATAQPIFEKVKADTEKSMIPLPLNATYDMDAIAAMYRQQEHLLEALGLMRHRAAESLLIMYLPTPPLRICPPDIRLDTLWIHALRIRAIWALGKIYENDPQQNVVASLSEKLDAPDTDEVGASCAISLGRMQAKSVLPQLRKQFEPGSEYTMLKFGCAWGVAKLTGEPIANLVIKPV
ncbi:MAG: hypothetical protein JWN70_7215, partial [Planctomycetaceae bacterium]|nr:hypothetical protein [Planctomycetaceae bacterium]